MKINLSGKRVLEITIGSIGKPARIILWFKKGSRRRTDFRKEIRSFLRKKGIFIAFRCLGTGFFYVDTETPIKILTLLQFACWLEYQKK